jgi:hypothetical protein
LINCFRLIDKAAQDTPKDDVLAVLENILADRRGRE